MSSKDLPFAQFDSIAWQMLEEFVGANEGNGHSSTACYTSDQESYVCKF